jgi:hypothetical protein
MKIKKLTRQYNGSEEFTHMVQYILKDAGEFVKHRAWCWETWGPSCELEYRHRLGEVNANLRWCWMSDDNGRIRIYFASATEASHFGLRWS